MLPRFCQFRGRRRRGIGSISRRTVKHPSRWNPPMAIPIQVEVTALIIASAAKHLRGTGEQILFWAGSELALIGLRQKPWCEGELVAFTRQREWLDFAGR